MAQILICAPDPLTDDLHGTVVWREGNERHLAASFQEAFVMAVAVRPVWGSVLNLSATGMLIEASGPLAIGVDLDFKFLLPGSSAHIRGTGRIVREAKKGCFGVHFYGLEGDGVDRVKAFVGKDR